MADTLISGTTLVEKESRSIGDIPVGGIVEWDDTFGNLPDGYVLADGTTINDPLSVWDGTAVQDLNTQYCSINAASWISRNPDTNDVKIEVTDCEATTGSVTFAAGINLPDGATITSVIIYGNAGATAETWTLDRVNNNATTQVAMASANFGTEDTSIINPIIDNLTYTYGLRSTSLDSGDEIWGGTITYTPRNKFIMRVR